MSKIVVLNSGGFDSVVLSHQVRNFNVDKEIHNLFFDYGQLNVNAERECSKNCADKLGFIYKEVTIPKFTWSNSVLSGGEEESQYIPSRNVILISYALSYAEAIGADEIYCAFINPECEYYKDTSPLFLEKINELSRIFGIKVLAPFIQYYKGGLLKSLARAYGIAREEVHSCNFGDEPCNVCSDCVAMDEIFNDVDAKLADDIFIDSNFEITEDFIESVKQSKVTTAKLYINNACQFSCSHCFIGKHKLLSTQLTIEEWCKVIEDLHNCGITNIDFFGKEPLFDAKIFTLLEKCKSLGVNYSLITNGVNVEKYIERLDYYKPKVTLSVESLGDTDYRDTGKFLVNTIKLLLSRGIPMSVSIDLTNKNAGQIAKIIKNLYDIGVRDFYVKPLRPFGDAEEYLMENLISTKAMFKCMKQLQKLNDKLKVNIMVSLAMMDAERFYQDDPEGFDEYFGKAIVYRLDYVKGITIEVELYCHRFKEMISITPEGYVLGCASEYCTDYSNYMNVKEHSVEECISKGKESLNEDSYSSVGCHFCKLYKKEGKIFQ